VQQQVVRLRPADGRRVRRVGLAARGGVVEPQLLPRPDRLPDAQQHRGVGLVPGGATGEHDAVDAAREPLGHRAQHGVQRPLGGLLDARAERARAAQRDGEGDRLLVVEHQRRQVRPGPEAVAAVAPPGRLDRVPQLAQALGVTADRALADLEPFRQHRRRPVPRRLQQ
jgi:hypothetical protein